MLPSHLRLDLRHFLDFFSQAKNISAPHLRILYQPHLTDKQAPPSLQFAVIVPKRHGKAIVRVKTKRRVRHAILTLSKELPAVFALPYSVAVLVKGPPQEYTIYEQELRQLLERLTH
jgi:ribonuclease P protein component